MSTTPEGRVKKMVRKVLKEWEEYLYMFMPVQRGEGRRGLDFHCHYRGLAFYIETKAPGKKLTPLQQATADEMKLTGAPVFVVRSEQDMAPLLDWLRTVESRSREQAW